MQNAWRFIDDENSSGARHAKADPPADLAPRPTTNKAAEKIPVPFERHARPAKAGKAGRPPSCTRRRRPTSRRSAEAADRNLTTRATQPTETGLAGWAYRIRTGESVRELSNWNFVTTSAGVVQARRRRPFAWEQRCTNLQLRPRIQQPRRVYGDYSLAALDKFISTKFSISAFSRVCD